MLIGDFRTIDIVSVQRVDLTPLGLDSGKAPFSNPLYSSIMTQHQTQPWADNTIVEVGDCNYMHHHAHL